MTPPYFTDDVSGLVPGAHISTISGPEASGTMVPAINAGMTPMVGLAQQQS